MLRGALPWGLRGLPEGHPGLGTPGRFGPALGRVPETFSVASAWHGGTPHRDPPGRAGQGDRVRGRMEHPQTGPGSAFPGSGSVKILNPVTNMSEPSPGSVLTALAIVELFPGTL